MAEIRTWDRLVRAGRDPIKLEVALKPIPDLIPRRGTGVWCNDMHSPAIHAALDNLVETIRTSLMAEFLELLRAGKPALPKAARKKVKRAAVKKKAKARSTR